MKPTANGHKYPKFSYLDKACKHFEPVFGYSCLKCWPSFWVKDPYLLACPWFETGEYMMGVSLSTSVIVILKSLLPEVLHWPPVLRHTGMPSWSFSWSSPKGTRTRLGSWRSLSRTDIRPEAWQLSSHCPVQLQAWWISGQAGIHEEVWWSLHD